MLKRLAVVLSIVLLTACATGTPIKDFTDRSVGYGWLDIKDVEANTLSSVYIYQYRPKTTEPFYPTKVKEFKNGFLYYHTGLPIGSLKTHAANGQRCLGILCSNATYRYSFGKQGDEVGAVVIKAPGVYHLGSYKLKDVKTGFFEEGKFDVEVAANAPSRREMLEEILKDLKDNEIMAERVKRELAQLR